MITINSVLFAFICAFAGIGALLFLIFILFSVSSLIELLQKSKRKTDIESARKCPDLIEKD